MTSFDVDSLFTSIPLQKTIDLCVELKNCSCKFKPVIYKRCVDEAFILFRSKYHGSYTMIKNVDVT